MPSSVDAAHAAPRPARDGGARGRPGQADPDRRDQLLQRPGHRLHLPLQGRAPDGGQGDQRRRRCHGPADRVHLPRRQAQAGRGREGRARAGGPGEGRLPGRLHLERRGAGHLGVRQGSQDPLLRHALPDLAADLGRRPQVRRPHHQQREPVRPGAGQEGGHAAVQEVGAHLARLRVRAQRLGGVHRVPEAAQARRAGHAGELAEARARPTTAPTSPPCCSPTPRRSSARCGARRRSPSSSRRGRSASSRRSSSSAPRSATPTSSIRSARRRPIGALTPGFAWYDDGMQKRHPKLAEWVKKYQDRTKKEPTLGASWGYASAYIIVEAIKRAKSAETDKVIAALGEGYEMEFPWGKVIMRGCDMQAIPPQWIGRREDERPGQAGAGRHRGDARQGRDQAAATRSPSSARPPPRRRSRASAAARVLDHQRAAHHRAGDERPQRRHAPVPGLGRDVADLRRHPHREPGPRLLLHGGRLPDGHAGRDPPRPGVGVLAGAARWRRSAWPCWAASSRWACCA